MSRSLPAAHASIHCTEAQGVVGGRGGAKRLKWGILGAVVMSLAAAVALLGNSRESAAATGGPLPGCSSLNVQADALRQTVNGEGTGVFSGRFDQGDQISFFVSAGADSTIGVTAINIFTYDEFSVTAPYGDFSTMNVTIPFEGTWSLWFTKTGTLAGMGSLGCTSGFVPAPQTISFADPGAKTLAQTPVALSATATSGLAVSFASTTPSVCTVSGSNATLVGVGTCSINATQAGDASYAAAAPVTRAFNVTPVCTGTLAPNGIGNFTYSTNTQNFSVASQLQGCLGGNIGPDGTSVTYSSAVTLPASVTSVAGGANTYYGQLMTLNAGLAPGAYTVTASYAPDTAGWYQAGNSPVAINFNVVKAGQTVSITDPGAKTAGGAPFAVTATATSGLPVTLSSPTPAVCTIAGNTVTLTGAGTCTINGDQTGNANYTAAPTATLNIAVGIAAQTISFTNPGPKTFGAAPFALTATASSGLPVAFASTTTGVCTVAGATVTLVGGGSCSITATQPGNASYAAATPVTQAFAVGTGAQTISFTRPADRTFVTGGTVPLTASATSGLAVSFASNSTAICSVAGGVATMIAAGQCSITARQAGNASYAAATPVTQTFAQTQMTTSTTLTSSANPIFLNQPFTLTAVVTASESTPPPGRTRQAAPAPASLTGTVTFAMGGTTLCGGVALSGGVAVCNTAITAPGSQTIVATFSGGGSYGVSTSNIVAQTVVDQRAKTAQVVGRFMGQRTNLLASNEPDGGRQIDRLMEAGGQGGTQGAGLADNPEGERSMRAATSSRLGAGADAGDIGRMRLGARTDRPLQDSFAGSQRDDNPFPADTSTGRTIDTPHASGGSLAAGPLRFSGSTDGAARFGFSTSLRDVARHAAQAEADTSGDAELGLGGRSGRTGGKARPNPFDIWAEGKYADFRDDRRNRDLDGHFGLFSAGADYVLRPNLLLGALVQFDSMSQTSEKDRTKVRGEGWMAGPYATLRLSPNVFWQMRAAWGRSDNEVSPYMTFTDKFSSQRWLASTTLAGRWGIGPWTLKPSLSVTYLEDVAESFTETHGTIVPEVKSRLGQAKVGPEISYRYHLHDGIVLEPRAGMQLIWNFSGDTTIAGQGQFDGENAGPQGVRGRAEIGLRASTIGGVGLDLSGSYDGIGASGYSAVTGRAGVRVPLN